MRSAGCTKNHTSARTHAHAHMHTRDTPCRAGARDLAMASFLGQCWPLVDLCQVVSDWKAQRFSWPMAHHMRPWSLFNWGYLSELEARLSEDEKKLI